MNNELYFRLSALMKDDDRVIELICHLGMAGFGIYISLLMELRKRTGYKCALRTLAYLAEQWKVSADVLHQVVYNYDLFGFDGPDAKPESVFFSTELCESMAALDEWRTAKRKQKQANADSSNPATTVFEPDESVETPLEAGCTVSARPHGVTVKRARNGRFTVKNKDASINRLNSINSINTSTEKEEEKESKLLMLETETETETAVPTNTPPIGSSAEEASPLSETVVLIRHDKTQERPPVTKLRLWTAYHDEAFANRAWVEVQAVQSG